MKTSIKYKKQVQLLLDILPIIEKYEVFALKGGTALNLFIWDMPRLSVDIDLAYLPLSSREKSLKDIIDNLTNIKKELEQTLQIKVVLNDSYKLMCSREGVLVKIEVNTIIRGSFLQPEKLCITDKVQNDFGRFSSMNVLNKCEIYGSKICAALDRQHPRDIFDISKIIGREGDKLNNKIKDSFIFYLLSHNRPISELLYSKINDKKDDFEHQFYGMTEEKFDYDDFIKFSVILRERVRSLLSNDDKKFILSFKQGDPNWSLFCKDVSQFPSIQWKLNNIKNLQANNYEKHKEAYLCLEAILSCKTYR